LISESIWAISLAIIISTVLTIVVVAYIQDKMENKQLFGKIKKKKTRG